MTNILHIDSSLFGQEGKSSRLAAEFANTLLNANPASQYQYRDLHSQPIPHLDGERFAAFSSPEAELNDYQKEVLALSDTLISELKAAKVLILGVPMYNLGVPSTLKAWIDHVARAGQTFRYTENGPQGLLNSDTNVYVLAARGGQYQGTEMDTQSTYLRHILGLMGLTKVEFIYAEGLNLGEDTAATALKDAQSKIATTLAA
ncbi:acyl carrier protein phosphodiesterase [Spongiibacter sp. IMCC21906]|jgi:FMN-dependent NADH-azoreductase|uniref:FMN-dependent NADH-azoreductase n=1 Tax=Spongiibacter sp. IMCC21906 TaxID=1620392 RepID=UPI00062DD0E9|nr:FMN-dependent NADH-azoreductase [Spongiibacter sp. IMCC21906]AKH68159.1 acyl carrier protein phosphodiesterase [Spongiibacter sp. IMCC21906]